MVVKVEFMVFWVVVPCIAVDGYQLYKGQYYQCRNPENHEFLHRSWFSDYQKVPAVESCWHLSCLVFITLQE